MPEPDPIERIVLGGELERLCDDARSLLEFALTERRASAPAMLDPTTLAKITDVVYPHDLASVSRQAWNDFLAAYETLSIFTYPVTAQTLRDTAETGRAPGTGLLDFAGFVAVRDAFGMSGSKAAADAETGTARGSTGRTAAGRVTRLLWISTSFFLAMIGATEFLQTYTQDREAQIFDYWFFSAHMLTAMQPFFYGGLGACAFLLRSVHRLIAVRAFNGCYRPEYLNRILLGVISGGTVSMFVAVGADSASTGLALSKAALGFLAGYSTDFLFKTIERILEALFPRDATAPPPAAKPPPPKPPT